MGNYSDEEVAEAFAEYRRLGVGEFDWPGWARLFTDDAVYIEHHLGRFEGQQAIETFIVDCMAQYPSMGLWMDWWAIGDDRVALYIWNNLPDPAGTGKRYGFPNTTGAALRGRRQVGPRGGLLQPRRCREGLGRVVHRRRPTRHSARPHARGHRRAGRPRCPPPAFPRDEVEREFLAYRERGSLAVATGDWDQWAAQFTPDARYREHHYGTFDGREEIRAWITSTMVAFPEMTFPVDHYIIDGNRVVAQIPNCLPDPTGGDTEYRFEVHVILHYAGNGQWSYEEDVYNPKEAEEVIGRWIQAGGTVPTAPG